ncbi:MAG: glycoside hydrolase family 3 C-terminal domain-containing protein, partial [Gemmatimonadaceae bacterium]
ETFFPPFKAAIDRGHARSVMSAYNSVDGSPATQSHFLLDEILKGAWKFSGFIISDAAATGGATVLHHTEASTATATKDAFEAGLDVVFQSSWPQHRPYLAAFQRGLVPDSIVNASVSRVLTAKFQLGLFEHPYANPDSAARWNNAAEHRELARAAAREAIVLLKNDHDALPLSPSVRSIAVIGADAIEARLGGYSGPGVQPVSILTGIEHAAGKGTTVRFAPGPGRVTPEYVVVPGDQLSTLDSGRTVRGVRGEYFDNNRLAGQPRFVRVDRSIDERWTLNSPGRGLPFDWYSVRWTGTLNVPPSGVKRLGIEGNDGYRLYLDGKRIIDDWEKRSYGSTLATVHLEPGTSHDIRVEYFESTGNARVKLVWDAGVPNDWSAKIRDAVDSAKKSSLAVVVAGIEEGEFRDRAFLSLPGHQEELIQRVAATGKPTIVVLVGGSAITMSRWIDRVAAVVDAWYPGVEGGNAVADVLFGTYDPAGRLPITFAMSEGQLPLTYNHKPTGRGDDYLDLTGYPLFPFGYGLSYTTFQYTNLTITPAELRPNESAVVRCTITNSGRRAGDEVAQLYVHDVLASVARPVIQLAGFERVHLEPGESKSVQFTLGPEQLQMLDRDLHWVVEPGTFRVLVGASSKDIRLRDSLVVR